MRTADQMAAYRDLAAKRLVEIERLKDSVERLSLALELAGVHPNLVRDIASGTAGVEKGTDES